MKKISLLLLLFLFVVTGCSVKQKEEIYIVFTSDVHCGVAENFTFPALKAYVDELKSEHSYVSLVDTGDYIQGGTLGTLSKGEIIINLMNEMGYDLVTIGNHEFDYGMDRLSQLMGMMNFDVVASNVKYTGSSKNIFEDVPEYVIKDYDGIKVGFLGVITPESLVSSTPKYFMENGEYVYDFYSGNDGQDLYDKVQSLVDEMKKQRVNYVVVLTHLGSAPENAPYDSISLISNTSGIDVVIDGHSHSLITEDKYPNKEGKDVILSSVGTKLQEVGQLIIDTEGNMSVMHISEYDKTDETMQKKLDEANSQLETILSQVIGTLDVNMSITDEEGIRISRSRETNMGNYVADAFRYYLDTDIAYTNGGGVRSGIEAGEISYGDLLAVTPFQNTLSSCYASGQQILDMLEFTSRVTEGIYKFDGNAVGEFGGFAQVSGLKYTIDTSVETPVVVDEDGVFVEIEKDKPRRVSDVMVLENGEYVPIDPNKTYTVASVSYTMFDGGDGNTLLKDCEKVNDSDALDIDASIAYFEYLNNDFSRYQETEGRITVK